MDAQTTICTGDKCAAGDSQDVALRAAGLQLADAALSVPFACACPSGSGTDSATGNGVSWSGMLCEVDVDECAAANGGKGPCASSCVNTAGSFRCACPAQQALAEDRRGCKSLAQAKHEARPPAGPPKTGQSIAATKTAVAAISILARVVSAVNTSSLNASEIKKVAAAAEREAAAVLQAIDNVASYISQDSAWKEATISTTAFKLEAKRAAPAHFVDKKLEVAGATVTLPTALGASLANYSSVELFATKWTTYPQARTGPQPASSEVSGGMDDEQQEQAVSLGSEVLSLSFKAKGKPIKVEGLAEPLTLVFTVLPKDRGAVLCSYWKEDGNASRWGCDNSGGGGGCAAKALGNNTFECSYRHMTDFGALKVREHTHI